MDMQILMSGRIREIDPEAFHHIVELQKQIDFLRKSLDKQIELNVGYNKLIDAQADKLHRRNVQIKRVQSTIAILQEDIARWKKNAFAKDDRRETEIKRLQAENLRLQQENNGLKNDRDWWKKYASNYEEHFGK